MTSVWGSVPTNIRAAELRAGQVPTLKLFRVLEYFSSRNTETAQALEESRINTQRFEDFVAGKKAHVFVILVGFIDPIESAVVLPQSDIVKLRIFNDSISKIDKPEVCCNSSVRVDHLATV